MNKNVALSVFENPLQSITSHKNRINVSGSIRNKSEHTIQCMPCLESDILYLYFN